MSKSTLDSASLGRFLTIELARASERAAVAAARLRGRGVERAADQAAHEAMRQHLSLLPANARIVIGESQSVSGFSFGEEIGLKAGPSIDLAIAPLEGATVRF